jgi:hypothetical protein
VLPLLLLLRLLLLRLPLLLCRLSPILLLSCLLLLIQPCCPLLPLLSSWRALYPF